MIRAPQSSPAPRRRSSEAGLTLIEVLVAVVVFTVGALSLVALIPTGMSKVTNSEADTRASALAAERSEQLLITPYEDPDLDAGLHLDDQNPHDGMYNVKWNVEVDEPVTECKRVTVTVHRSTNDKRLSRLVIVVPHSAS
jgi:prepilin-type N-terminal cleavage/methylation domain-containing protein